MLAWWSMTDCNQVLLREVFPLCRFDHYRRALCLLDPYKPNVNRDVLRTAGQMRSIDSADEFHRQCQADRKCGHLPIATIPVHYRFTNTSTRSIAAPPGRGKDSSGDVAPVLAPLRPLYDWSELLNHTVYSSEQSFSVLFRN